RVIALGMETDRVFQPAGYGSAGRRGRVVVQCDLEERAGDGGVTGVERDERREGFEFDRDWALRIAVADAADGGFAGEFDICETLAIELPRRFWILHFLGFWIARVRRVHNHRKTVLHRPVGHRGSVVVAAVATFVGLAEDFPVAERAIAAEVYLAGRDSADGH